MVPCLESTMLETVLGTDSIASNISLCLLDPRHSTFVEEGIFDIFFYCTIYYVYTYFQFRIFDIIYAITLVNKEQIKCFSIFGYVTFPLF